MSIISSVTGLTGRVAGDVRGSVRRARLEGERRVLERRHRAALEALGARTYELVAQGGIDGTALTAEMAEVQRRLDDITAAVAAMDGAADESAATGRSADIAFPMVADNPEDDTHTG